jgi:hypothetical protein
LGLAIPIVLPVTALAYNTFIQDVNDSCGYTVINDNDCVFCHDPSSYAAQTDLKDLYLTEGACGFCPDSPSCTAAPPTVDQLLVDAQDTTNEYFEELFSQFMYYMAQAAGDFATVFPDCPRIAPEIASDFSRQTGYLVRRVTEKTRNSRNTPDDWELLQLRKFAKMAADGEPRTQFDITKPDGTLMPTMEYEVYEVVEEPRAKGKDKKIAGERVAYFRYMRSITMPGLDKLPCLKCHGTADQLAPGVQEMVNFYYPHDKAMGYVPGDVRGAWTIKIPLSAVPK